MNKVDMFWIFCTTVLLMLIIVTSSARLVDVWTESPKRPCPVNCTCDSSGQPDYLYIDCSGRPRDAGNRGVVPATSSIINEVNQYLSGLSGILSRLFIVGCVSLKEVPVQVCNMKLLRFLSMDDNAIERLLDNCLPRLRSLIEFSADGNAITTLQDGLFDGLSRLKVISLSSNRINTIGLHTFSTLSNLSSLVNINLNKNNLTQVDTWPFTLAEELPNFSVGLEKNYINKFTNKKKWIYHSGRINNFRLDLGSNRISSIDSLVKELNFTDLNDTISLFSETHFALKGNYGYVCNCIDFDLHVLWRSLKTSSLADILNVRCSNINNKEALNIPLEDFVCNVAYMCPIDCQCVNQPFNATFHILGAKSGFTDIPLNVTPLNTPNSLFIQKDLTKYKLDFSGNNISSFRARDYIRNASIVDLSSSRLVNITDEAMQTLEKVDKIYLHNNLLTSLPKIVTALNFSFTTFSFYNNPLSCECDQVWLKNWLIQVYNHLLNPNAILCSTPLWLNGRSIFSVNDTEFCSFPNLQLQSDSNILAIPISMVISIFIIIFGLIILCRFRVKVYSQFGIHPFDRDECEGEEMVYDVFIAFAKEDNQQASEVLRFLEDRLLRVCYHERDFMPGSPILRNIELAINGSKRVLCFVSDNFISSVYCLEEFERALHLDVTHKRRRLIVMMSENYELPTELDKNQNVADTLIADDVAAHLQEQQHFLLSSSSQEISLPEKTVKEISMLSNFVARNTYIKFQSDSTSWQPQLLYAMPMKRLGPTPGNE